MAKTQHYQCDVCKKVFDPTGERWERKASSVHLEIAGAWPQIKEVFSDVCPKCSEHIGKVIVDALDELRASEEEKKDA